MIDLVMWLLKIKDHISVQAVGTKKVTSTGTSFKKDSLIIYHILSFPNNIIVKTFS